jgi:flavin reductase (DIM6/NTAB) family NADH-FMN oxidoreductase RutF
VAVHPGGDHDIVVGEVLGMSIHQASGQPLLYFASAFRRLDDRPS